MDTFTKNHTRLAQPAAIFIALAALAFAPASALADFEFTTNSGATDSDGSLSAKAYFTLQNGQITLYLANLTSGAQAQGQAISGITFMVNGQTDTSLSLKSVAGNVVNLNGGTFSPPSYQTFNASGTPATAANWAYDNTIDKTLTLNAFNPSNPNYMIVGPNASFSGNGGSNFNPYFQSTATTEPDLAEAPLGSSVVFALNAPGITANSTISSVNLFFGTGPDIEVGTNGGFVLGGQSTVLPEPSTIVLALTGFVSFGLAGLRRRRQQRAGASA